MRDRRRSQVPSDMERILERSRAVREMALDPDPSLLDGHPGRGMHLHLKTVLRVPVVGVVGEIGAVP